MTCPECELAATRKHHGVYRMHCAQCCARLVASARPSRQHQEAMLAAIARFRGAPTRQEVLERLQAKSDRAGQQGIRTGLSK